MVFPVLDKTAGLVPALNRICSEAAEAAEEGYQLIVLSDRNAGNDLVPISSLLALGAVHHHLIKRVSLLGIFAVRNHTNHTTLPYMS